MWNLKVEDWESTLDFDFGQNCLFIHEAGFNLHTQRNDGRSRKGTPSEGIIPTVKGKSINMFLGAISQADIIAVSLQKGQAVSGTKKRKN